MTHISNKLSNSSKNVFMNLTCMKPILVWINNCILAIESNRSVRIRLKVSSYSPGIVISSRKDLDGLWQASELKSSSIVPMIVKKMPHGLYCVAWTKPSVSLIGYEKFLNTWFEKMDFSCCESDGGWLVDWWNDLLLKLLKSELLAMSPPQSPKYSPNNLPFGTKMSPVTKNHFIPEDAKSVCEIRDMLYIRFNTMYLRKLKVVIHCYLFVNLLSSFHIFNKVRF